MMGCQPKTRYNISYLPLTQVQIYKVPVPLEAEFGSVVIRAPNES